MADSLKRITKAKDRQFQDRVGFYMWNQANVIFDQETPDPDDLSIAKAIFANQVSLYDMAMIVITNATIGTKIDSDQAVPDSDIEYSIVTENKFHDLAESYKAAGLIS